jgi:hypothetical protein
MPRLRDFVIEDRRLAKIEELKRGDFGVVGLRAGG